MGTAAPAEFIAPPDYEIFNPYADKAVRFINGLTHGKGRFASHSFDLRPWQEFKIIRPIFGLVDENGKRITRTAYMEIPRKNGKTEIAAAVGLKCLAADGEQEGEVYCAASDREQASIVFNAAAGMVRRNKFLNDKCRIIDSKKRIIYKPTGGILQALSKEAASKEGYNASAVIYDEVHAAKDRFMWEVLTDSVGTREQPLVFAITTAGFDTNTLWGELRDYAFKVRDGEIDDPSFLPILFCAPKDADWTDRKLWFQVNPALGDFRQADEFEEKFLKALHIPSRQNRFRRVYLCQETDQEECWLPPELWKEAEAEIDLKALEGRPAFIGLDLSSTHDVTALVLLIPDLDVGCYAFPFFFLPEEGIREKGRLDQADYKRWVEEGHLLTTPGNVVDYDFIYNLIVNDLAQRFNIQNILIDRWNATQLSTQLMGALGDDKVTLFGQGFASMSAPSKDLEKLLLSKRIRVQNNSVFRWMAKNVSIQEDAARNIKPVKPQKGSKKRIDGIVALIMALGGAAAQLEPMDYDAYFKEGWSM